MPKIKTVRGIENRKVASQKEWLVARKKLLGGAACCVCCAAPMTIQLALGIMNPLVMIVVAIVIAAEKILPRPAIVTRLVGISAIIAGVASFCADFLRPS